MTKKNISGWNAVTPGKTEKRKDLKKVFGRAKKGKLAISFRKKLEKGKTLSQIADELEDTEENIGRLIEQFHLSEYPNDRSDLYREKQL